MNESLFKTPKIHNIDRLTSRKLEELLDEPLERYSHVFVLMDENTEKYCYGLMKHNSLFFENLIPITIPAGEHSKRLETAEEIWMKLLNYGADRKSLLINLGGGMITDLGAFVASTFKRGMSFIHLPTSLIGQIDAAIGGKTAVNLEGYKNQIGTFAAADMIIISPGFLETLPERYLLSGYAEIIKHGLIANSSYFEWLKNYPFQRIKDLKNNRLNWKWIINESVSIKSRISEVDPFDWGLRRLLNFGHTIGHAIEAFSLKNDSNPVTHGEAVATGMVVESVLSRNFTGLQKNSLEQIIGIIKASFPLFEIDEEIKESIISLIKFDKKRSGGSLNFTLLNAIGHGVSDQECTMDDVSDALDEYIQVIKRIT